MKLVGYSMLLVLVLVMVMLGCSGSATAKMPENIIIGIANPKPTAFGTALADIVTKYTPMKGTTEQVRANAQALDRIAKNLGAPREEVFKGGCTPCHRVAVWEVAQGTCHIGVYPPTATIGINDKDKTRLRVLFSGFGPDTATLLALQTTPKSNIASVSDLKGKRVYAENTSILVMAPVLEAILKGSGMTRNDIRWTPFTSSDAAFKDVAEGKADAIFYQPSSSSEAITKSTDLVVLPLTPQAQKAVESSGQGFVAATWPAGLMGNKVATPVVGAPYVVWSADSLPEEAAYLIVKAAFEHLTELQSVPGGAGFSRETALVLWDYPYHPGAIKYFTEAGIWKPEMDQKQAQALSRLSKT